MKAKLFLLILLFSITSFSQEWTNFNNDSTPTHLNGLVSNYISTITIDSQSNIWFGTDKGVSRYNNTNWTTYNKFDGLVDNEINSITIDSRGNKWFGTSNGVSKFNDTSWTNYTTIDGLISNYVMAVAIDLKGNKWFGTSNGVSKFNDTIWTTFNTNNGLISPYVFSIAIDSYNNIWFGTDKGVLKYDNNSWINYNSSNALVDNFVKSIFVDVKGNIWVVSSRGVNKFDGSNWIKFSMPDYPFVYASDIYIDSQDNVWLATNTWGLKPGWSIGVLKLQDGNWINYSTYDGLINNEVNTVAIDKNDIKWFGTNNGVSKLDESKVNILNPKIGNHFGSEIEIYPNPTIDEVSINFPLKGKCNLILTDINGKIIIQLLQLDGEKTNINIKYLEPGLYFVTLISNNYGKRFTGKFLVTR